MPLYGAKLFKTISPAAAPIKAPIKAGDGGETYKIDFSGEKFTNKQLYEDTLKLYNERVWTDRCTGEIHLTYKEALDTEEEVFGLLKEEFDEKFCKPALEVIHHNVANLDDLVKRVWEKCHQELQMDEVVTWKMAPSKYGDDVRGRIIAVDRSQASDSSTTDAKDGDLSSSEGKPVTNGPTSQNCASPSSDKENNSLKEEIVVNGGQKTATATTNADVMVAPDTPSNSPSPYGRPSRRASQSPMFKEKSSRPRTVPTLLPLLYDIQLIDDDDEDVKGRDGIIKSIPAQHFSRVKPPPTKENTKYFVRSFALRIVNDQGKTRNGPWVVDEEKVAKYGLTSKLHAMFLPKGGGLHISMEELKGNEEAKEKEKRDKLEKEKERQREKERLIEEERMKKEEEREKKEKLKLLKEQREKTKKEKEEEDKERKLTSPNNENAVGHNLGIPWSAEEKEALMKGVAEFGKEWAKIVDNYQDVFAANARTNRNLMDKWRNMETVRMNKEKRDTDKKRKVDDGSESGENEGPSSPKKLKTENNNLSVSAKKKLKQVSIAELMRKRSPHKSPLKVKILGSPNKMNGASPIVAVKRTPLKQVKPLLVVKLEKSYAKYASVRNTIPSSTPSTANSPDVKPSLSEEKKPDILLLSPSKKVEYEKRLRACTHIYHKFLKMATMTLSEREIAMCPAEVISEIKAKKLKLADRARLAAMSEEERQAHFKEKQRLQNKQRLEALRAKRAAEGKKDDQEFVDATPLPNPNPVWTPEDMSMESFGSVVMVTNFLCTYQSLIYPDSTNVITTKALLKALGEGEGGFETLSDVLIAILQTLLQDQISEDYKELKTPLRDIAINKFTATELIRLAMRKRDEEDEEDEEEDEDDDEEESDKAADDELNERLLSKLEDSEFCSLSLEDKLEVLVALVDRILNSYSVADHMEKKLDESKAAWRHRLKTQSEAKKLRTENEEGKAGHSRGKSGKSEPAPPPPPPSGSGPDDDNEDAKKNPEKMEVDEDVPEGSDMASVVKRRRVVAVRDAKEREERKKEEEEQRRKESEEYKAQLAKEKMERDFNEAVLGAKTVLRQVPLGSDRNHSRYWFFGEASPGLYVEKGWSSKFSLTNEVKEVVEEVSEDEGMGDEEMETTAPETGLNMWFVYDKVEDVESLLTALHPRGIRESKLKAELSKQLPLILKTIEKAERRKKKEEEEEDEAKPETDATLANSNTKDLSMEGLRTELMDAVLRLGNGGLGGVKDSGKFELKLAKCTKLADFVPLVITVQESVLDKFRQGVFVSKKVKTKNEEGEIVGEESQPSPVILVWKEAVKDCTTFSRMHVLLGLLDSCIMWEKSAENAKCKVCRKKGDESKVLLCDGCNEAFHMYCLRPALWVVPKGDWMCPGCAPMQQRSCRKERKNYKEASQAEAESESEEDGYSGSEEEEEIEHDKDCVYCGGEDKLIQCAKCPYSYHVDCHQPPLRREPRSTWVCEDCRSGERRSRRTLRNLFNKTNKKASPKKRRR